MATLGALGALSVLLRMDTAEFESDVGRAQTQAVAFGSAIGTVLGNALTSAGSHFLNLTRNAIDSADELGKFAQKAGMSTEAMSSMAVSARLSDVSNATLKTGLRALANTAEEAQKGNNKAADSFKAIGVSVTDANGKLKGTEQLFAEVSKKMAGYTDSAQKTALANDLMGRSGAELLPMMNGLSETADLAKKLGATLDKDTAQGAEKFNDNLTLMRISSEAMGMKIAQVLLPTLGQLTDKMVTAATDTRKLESAARVADTGLKLLVTGATIGVAVFDNLGRNIGAVAAALVQAAQGNFSAAWRILTDRAQEARVDLQDTIDGVKSTWDATSSEIAGKAEATGDKLAAPTVKAREKVKKATDDVAKMQYQAFLAEAAIQKEAEAATQDFYRKRGDTIEKAGEKAAKDRELMNKQVLETIDMEAAADEERQRIAAGIGQAAEKTDSAWRQMGGTISSHLEDIIFRATKAGEVIRALGKDVAMILFRKSITEPLAEGVSSAAKPLGDSIGDFFKGMFRAEGGAVSGGSPYIVGERGPELFVPGASGAIVPNDALGGGGGNTFMVDMRGASVEAVARLERLVHQINGTIEPRAISAMRSARTRGMV